MMIDTIQLTSFRNLNDFKLSFAPEGVTILHGKNGSGKTSVLEAIHILSTGRSFRTSDMNNVIMHGSESYSIFSKVSLDERLIPVGLGKATDAVLQVKMEGKSAKIAELSRLLPTRLINPTAATQLFEAGPNVRRQFVDWGMFHVKHSFLECWKAFHWTLKQRNAAIKARCSQDEMHVWNQKFCEHSEALHLMRVDYVKAFEACFRPLVANIPLFDALTFDYLPGWPSEETLEVMLASASSKEREVGHSLYGPHRADISVKVNHILAKDVFSRGQLKLLLVAMYLAQGAYLQEVTGKPPIYLIDDFASELDDESQCLLAKVLQTQKAQVIITSLELTKGLLQFSEVVSSKSYAIAEGVLV